jgi:hypothetical protein
MQKKVDLCMMVAIYAEAELHAQPNWILPPHLAQLSTLPVVKGSRGMAHHSAHSYC